MQGRQRELEYVGRVRHGLSALGFVGKITEDPRESEVLLDRKTL